MKGGIAAAALAAMASGANAINHLHAHELFKKSYEVQQCSQKCTTIYTTITGEATRMFSTAPFCLWTAHRSAFLCLSRGRGGPWDGCFFPREPND